MDSEAQMNTTIEISYAILSGEKIALGLHGEAISVCVQMKEHWRNEGRAAHVSPGPLPALPCLGLLLHGTFLTSAARGSLVAVVFALPGCGWAAYCGRRYLTLGQAEGRGIYNLYSCMHGCMYSTRQRLNRECWHVTVTS